MSFLFFLLHFFYIKLISNTEIFVANKRQECSSPSAICDGSRENPFGTLIRALESVIEMNEKINNDKKLSISLEPNSQSFKYLVLDSDFPQGIFFSPFSGLQGFFGFFLYMIKKLGLVF